jgi:uncharacterized protein
MARSKLGFYNTIEYIGPRPQKPKRQNFFGGWVIVVIAVGIACWFGRPLVPFLKAAQEGVSVEQAEILIQSLSTSDAPGDRLAASALAHSGDSIAYDPSYYKISYPNGDVASGKGNSADVVVRCLRKIGIDLQKEVHEDMTQHFRLYPQLWGALTPDPNIDHRRVANLQAKQCHPPGMPPPTVQGTLSFGPSPMPNNTSESLFPAPETAPTKLGSSTTWAPA